MASKGETRAPEPEAGPADPLLRYNLSGLDETSSFPAERSLSIVTTSAGRATFMAGYAYYELGRYSHSADLVPYPIALGLSFGFAVLSAVIAASISFYILRLGKDVQGLSARRLSHLVTICVESFQLSLICNLVSIGMLGHRYYPDSDMKMVPFACAVCIGVLMVIARGYLQSTWQLMKFVVKQDREETMESGEATSPSRGSLLRSQALLESADTTAFRSVLVLAFAQAGIARYQPALDRTGTEEEDWIGRLNRLYLYLVTLSTCLAFFAVFAATNIAIFMNEFPPGRQRETAHRFMRSFWALSDAVFRAALGCMMLAVVFMGYGCSYRCDEECELGAKWNPQPLCESSGGVSAYATSGDCYQKLAYLLVLAGGVGATMFVGGTMYTQSSVAEAKASARQAAQDEQLERIEASLNLLKAEVKNAGSKEIGALPILGRWKTYVGRAKLQGAAIEDDSEDMRDMDALAAAASTFGGQATIIASTVFYNIVTFETDVLNPYIGWGWLSEAGRGKGISFWTTSFLLANLAAFVGGLSCLFLSELFKGNLQALRCNREKLAFVQAMAPMRTLLFVSFQLALAGFFSLFALMGMAKYDDGAMTFVLGGLGLLVTVWGSLTIYHECQAALLLSTKALQKLKGDWKENEQSGENAPPQERKQREHERITAQLGFYAPRATFFGSFAYNACVFLYRWHLPISKPYLILMGASFMCSLTVLTWHTTWHVCLSRLSEDDRKEAFARQPRILRLSRKAFMLYLSSVFFFLFGFSLFGWIKNDGSVCGGACMGDAAWIKFYDYAWMMAAAGSVGVYFTFHSWRLSVSESFVAEELDSQLASGKGTAPKATVGDNMGWQPMVSLCNSLADQTTFVAGNVFYQILFSQVQRDSDWEIVNWVYFGCASASLITGVVTIVFATMLAVFCTDISTSIQKEQYNEVCSGLCSALFSFYLVAMLFWICSFTFLAAVNYHQDYWTTAGPGACLFVATVAVWLYTRSVFWQMRHHKTVSQQRWPLQQYFGGVLGGDLLPSYIILYLGLLSLNLAVHVPFDWFPGWNAYMKSMKQGVTNYISAVKTGELPLEPKGDLPLEPKSCELSVSASPRDAIPGSPFTVAGNEASEVAKSVPPQ
ncbi:hypothetical protein CYMTET_52028 [Cymbomonas tetramitiformis]|uniref:Uncharacterized protein n=1 Tax=Cymbomonas tetramitiformis TaxID=36881 RepID=A0AAE0BJU7_9CHLO|nr:hypothetical protein CYMTET_52028 [Cymbomonas tetramitiformis]|eukprot:gene11977-14150_t